MSDDKKSEMVKIAGLHRERTAADGIYLSGSLNQVRVVIRPVERRESDTHPDHEMFITERSRPDKQPASDGGGEVSEPSTIRFAGLWTNKTRNGNVYLSGACGLARLAVFSNGYRQGPEDPDFFLYVMMRQRTKPTTDQEAPIEPNDGAVPF